MTSRELQPAIRFEVGQIVAGRKLEMSLPRVLAFSGGAFDEAGWPQANLHTNIDKAREAGLDHIIASGTQSEGLLIGLLIDIFGNAWHWSGELEVRFLKPVRVDDTVQPKLQWLTQAEKANTMRWIGSVWCETGTGERVIEGTASCTVPSGASQ